MNNKKRAYIALAIVSFFWGTTFLALRIGVIGFPPFLFSAVRQISAGILLFVILFLLKKIDSVTLKDIGNQILPGICLQSLGNGIVGWAELYIPTSLAALIVSIIPIYIFIMSLFTGLYPNKLSRKTIAGLLLSGLGITLIFKDNLKDLSNHDYFYGILACFGSSFFWALGSIYMKKNTFNTSTSTNAAIQLTVGGIGLLIASMLFDNYDRLSGITIESVWALLYLILIGSILTYLAYLFAVEHLPIIMVSIYAYINPLIAILLGYLILGETITVFTILALAAILFGVYLITVSNAEPKFKKTIKKKL